MPSKNLKQKRVQNLKQTKLKSKKLTHASQLSFNLEHFLKKIPLSQKYAIEKKRTSKCYMATMYPRQSRPVANKTPTQP
jgi:hypothetical protein